MPDQENTGVETLNGSLSQLTAVLALLAGAKLRLWKAGFVPTTASPQADFLAHEANFNGYGAGTVTWSIAGLGADDVARAVGSRTFFQAIDGVTPNTIGGWWLELGTPAASSSGSPEPSGTIVEWFGRFATTVPLDRPASFLALTPEIGSDASLTMDAEW